MLYNINIKAQIESNLSEKKLESQLVVALYDTENQYSKFDKIDENLEVIDYELTEAIPMCRKCNKKLVYRMFDIDGTNLEEHLVCENCGFGKPALR
jgi:predicted RNA-binding Zn-ribbon protein involved in translation (DUF1610 family)